MRMFSRIAALAATIWAVLAAGVMAQSVTGSVTYRERIALPPDAVLAVSLLDVSRQDVAATVLSSQMFAMTGVPADFALSYDPGLIDARFSYAVSAEIRVQDKVMFRTTQHYPVLTRDAGSVVEMVLTMANTAPLGKLTGSWALTELSGHSATGDKRPVLHFPEPGALSITGACNRFNGRVELDGDSIRVPDTMAGTMMACLPEAEALDRDLLKALTRATRFVQEDGSLVLLDGAGKRLAVFASTS